MQPKPIKKHPTIGCCGIDCGLCPRYHTEGKSRCPGCAGQDFFEKHPSCSVISCCLISRGLEACGNCDEFLCQKIKNWDSADSFVTHRTCICNLENIREEGLFAFIKQQEKRLRLLKGLLKDYDDGRSKSFYCLSAALLPIDELEKEIIKIGNDEDGLNERKQAAKSLREAFIRIARKNGIELSYRKKT